MEDPKEHYSKKIIPHSFCGLRLSGLGRPGNVREKFLPFIWTPIPTWLPESGETVMTECAFIDGLIRATVGEKSRVLDFTCGPGFYATELARRGHKLTGVDYSPASIRYGKNMAKEAKLPIKYHLAVCPGKLTSNWNPLTPLILFTVSPTPLPGLNCRLCFKN